MKEYPLISEYIEAIKSAEDNFEQLKNLRPVLDEDGNPVMSSGNFAVVFKMKDEATGKLHAVKCFLKEQEGRAEAYRMIAEELEYANSTFLTPIKYLDKELFVDTNNSNETEFPVLLMDWVEGITLDKYIREHIDNQYELSLLAYQFSRLAMWLMPQPFAHGDLKPDNIMVREDGTLVLVDYDGMYVYAMKGQKARELGSPVFRHPSRKEDDFNEHIDDFSLASILFSLKAISLQPSLLKEYGSTDRLLFSEKDYQNLSESKVIDAMKPLMQDKEFSTLLALFILAVSIGNLTKVSFRLFYLTRPSKLLFPEENLSTEVTEEEIANGVTDEFGVIYSKDGKRLLKGREIDDYRIKEGVKIICDRAFSGQVFGVKSIHMPNSLIAIGNKAFELNSMRTLTIPKSVKSIGEAAFKRSVYLESVDLPDTVTHIGKDAFSCCFSLQLFKIPVGISHIEDYTFSDCESLSSIFIPKSIQTIGNCVFKNCKSLHTINIPESVLTIGKNPFIGIGIIMVNCNSKNYETDGYAIYDKGKKRLIGFYGKNINSFIMPQTVEEIGEEAFGDNVSLQTIVIPKGCKNINTDAFVRCKSLTSISIPESIVKIGACAFGGCESLTTISIPNSVSEIGNSAFSHCKNLVSVKLPNNITEISDYTFLNCYSLRSIVIPKSVRCIGNSAFNNCQSIESIIVPENVMSIGSHAFAGCSSLQSISILNNNVKVGDGIFYGCNSLQDANVPSWMKIEKRDPLDDIIIYDYL